MPAVRRQLLIEQGATFNLSFVVLDDACEPVDLTGWTGSMQIRDTYDNETALLDLSAGITIDAATGRVTVVATPSETATLPAPAALVFDIVGTHTSGEVKRWVEGVARVSPGVTR